MNKCKKCDAELADGIEVCECGEKVETTTEVKTVKPEDMVGMVKDLTEAVKSLGADREDLIKKVDDLSKKTAERKAQFDISGVQIVGGSKRESFTKALAQEDARTYSVGGKVFSEQAVREFQQKADDVLMLGSILKVDPRSTKLYSEFAKETAELRKAMDAGTSGEGSDWVPTGWSPELIKLVRVEGKVANIHRRITMPNNPYKFPVVGSDPYMYRVSESTDDSSGKIKASTPGTSDLTFTATKLASRVLFSAELQEDSIVPVLPFIKEHLAIAAAETIEFNIVNGDVDGLIDNTDQAGGSIDANSALKSWDGYRSVASNIGSMVVDCNALFATSGATQNGDASLLNLRALFGKYGTDTGKLAWVTGPQGYLKMLALGNVQTVDKYGASATVLNGELGKYQGIPIIVTSGVREDLNTSGVSGGASSGNTGSQILLVNTSRFMLAERRAWTLESERDIETDQYKVVMMSRMDFQAVRGSAENTVGYCYDL